MLLTAPLLVLLAYTPLQPPSLASRRTWRVPAAPVAQFKAPDVGKMGSDFMSKLGMGGDLGISDEEKEKMEDRLRDGGMTFDDFLKQVSLMQKGANVQAMLGKMGGGGMTDEQLKQGQQKLVRYGEYVKFMDADEREEPALLIDETKAVRAGGQPIRLKRIADSSGVSVEDVGRFVMEFDMMRGAAMKFARGDNPDDIRQSMMEEQQQSAPPMNRQQRRMAAKKGKKKAKASGGFGR